MTTSIQSVELTLNVLTMRAEAALRLCIDVRTRKGRTNKNLTEIERVKLLRLIPDMKSAVARLEEVLGTKAGAA